jgi:hypothetical protein
MSTKAKAPAVTGAQKEKTVSEYNPKGIEYFAKKQARCKDIYCNYLGLCS